MAFAGRPRRPPRTAWTFAWLSFDCRGDFREGFRSFDLDAIVPNLTEKPENAAP
jgi:hypothetical protein